MKEEDLGAKEANERRPEAQKGVAHPEKKNCGKSDGDRWSLQTISNEHSLLYEKILFFLTIS